MRDMRGRIRPGQRLQRLRPGIHRGELRDASVPRSAGLQQPRDGDCGHVPELPVRVRIPVDGGVVRHVPRGDQRDDELLRVPRGIRAVPGVLPALHERELQRPRSQLERAGAELHVQLHERMGGRSLPDVPAELRRCCLQSVRSGVRLVSSVLPVVYGECELLGQRRERARESADRLHVQLFRPVACAARASGLQLLPGELCTTRVRHVRGDVREVSWVLLAMHKRGKLQRAGDGGIR